MKALSKFFDSFLAPLLLSFLIIFAYTVNKTDFFTAFIGSIFYSLIGGWFFPTPIAYFLASIFDFD
jgi:hypothetical protein